MHSAAWRPAAYWALEAKPPDLIEDDQDVMGRRPDQVAARLRWLLENDGFLDGELAAMKRRAEAHADLQATRTTTSRSRTRSPRGGSSRR